MGELTEFSKNKSFGGWVKTFVHDSIECREEMRFSVYLPPQAEEKSVPALYFLAGLTCTHENFITKAGAQRLASEKGIALICPDTSPRNAGVPGEDDSYDLGTGAGFYIDATESPWNTSYRMYSYITQELPILLGDLPINLEKQSIFGHSMGGHGALIAALKNPGKYLSVSAFAPICAPLQSDWGKKVFSTYLGQDRASWKAYDANELIKQSTEHLPILIDQGGDDEFLKDRLLLDIFRETCASLKYPASIHVHPGYDHGYYFISTFIDQHLVYHAERLGL